MSGKENRLEKMKEYLGELETLFLMSKQVAKDSDVRFAIIKSNPDKTAELMWAFQTIDVEDFISELRKILDS